ncbi:MAG: DUF5103 domain-containing protein [Bacteroidetes bacterium]|nr:DUF5103 domain-containing protein [Rhodothermia bacterium]MCS7155021.1 DUF5103 domain-containing protein [Bacteroidota bacterium]MCX7907305.1 DUF5103 domain-containing protein [Bacteroidota bacterium]MDW8137968.1 DUF5103 domain-containing protein [Bacteroidota bacterium]MDW8286180.1 DUF5103 domain-containing protein [Bacteroidota bacterium]
MLALALLGGCAGAGSLERFPSEATSDRTDSLTLATVQLFPTGAEEALPVLVLDQKQTLTLAFDWLGAEPPPALEVVFYHLDRTGRPDLLPTQYMARFDRDVVRDYRASIRTRIPYYHVRYTFPNEQIAFRLSGQYLVRVLHPKTDAVLLERRFYVSEQNLEARLHLDWLASVRGRLPLPVLRVRPPEFVLNPVGDLHACFAVNGRLEAPDCPPPVLLESPWVEYRSGAFRTPAWIQEPFVLDLTRLEGARFPRIRSVEFGGSGVRVQLDTDRLTSPTGGEAELLVGSNPIIRRYAPRADVDLTAEYVDVDFELELPERRRLEGPVFLVGSFNDFRPGAQFQMRYDPASGRYRATIRLKQGVYAYQYVTLDGRTGRLRPVFERLFPNVALFTAFVYYRDPRIPTDRLLWVGSALR